jgi:hypothetical protein
MPEADIHVPGTPKSPDPPRELVEVLDSLRHPSVTRTGLTTTRDGDWALMVRVRPGIPTPVPEVEAQARGFPVVYLVETPTPPVARPAYPARGG